MTSDTLSLASFDAVKVVPAKPAAPTVLVVCEHASNHVPPGFVDLGVGPDVLNSHVAWDPGALGVAEGLARHLSAVLVRGTVSRLVYDCNRPPDAPSAIPARSEQFDILGNTGLDAADREARVTQVYRPFEAALAGEISRNAGTLAVMVTVHSFTKVFHGAPRAVELGILHGDDDRFARSMMAMIPQGTAPRYEIRLNEPYSALDGVAHTLNRHGVTNGLLNVMIEIRNDLIATEAAQADMAAYLAPWIARSLDAIRAADAGQGGET